VPGPGPSRTSERTRRASRLAEGWAKGGGRRGGETVRLYRLLVRAIAVGLSLLD
jgi:hypothetical protein